MAAPVSSKTGRLSVDQANYRNGFSLLKQMFSLGRGFREVQVWLELWIAI
jgi:hypothetical protein